MTTPLPCDLREETLFWGAQFVDHAYLTSLGLAAPEQASVKGAAVRMFKFAARYLEGGPPGVLRLARDLSQLQNAVLAGFAPPKFAGWNFPSVLRHMMREQAWYAAIVNGKATVEDFVCLVAQDKMEAALVMSKMMDPSADALSREALALSDRLKALMERCRTDPAADLAKSLSREMDAFVSFTHRSEVAAAEKAMPMAEILHEAREAQHHRKILQRILEKA